MILNIKHILAKTITLHANQPDSNQYLDAAEEILDSLATFTPEELKAKIEPLQFDINLVVFYNKNMPINKDFKIKHLSPSDFENASVFDVSANRSFGRRFKVEIDGITSKKYIFRDIFKNVDELAKSTETLGDLKTLKSFVAKLKTADEQAEEAYHQRHRFLSWVHRLFSSRAHAEKLNHLEQELSNKITTIEETLQKNQSLGDVETVKPLTQFSKAPTVQDLSDTVKSGNVEAVKQLIQAGVDWNVFDSDGEAPLGWAALKGHVEILQILIDDGANVNMLNIRGQSPLMLTSQLKVTKVLLDHHADPNIIDENGKTALIWAVIEGDKGIVESLLTHNANAHFTDKDGETALIWAADLGYKEIIELLLAHNVDLNITNAEGQTALIAAVNKGHKEVAELLLAHNANANIIDKDTYTALMWAAIWGYKEIAESLLAHYADPRIIDKNGNTALMHAEVQGHKEIAKLFKNSMSPNELFLHKELLRLKLIGLSMNLAGKGTAQDIDLELPAASINLEGGNVPYLLKQMCHATQTFSRLYPDLLDDLETSQLIDFLNSGIKNSPEHTLERIESGHRTLLRTGYSGHAVAVLVKEPFFILCNPGESSRKVVEVFQYDPQKLTPEILTKINQSIKTEAEDYEKLFFEELPKALNFKPQGDFEKALEALSARALRMQMVGNCGWASSEDAVFCFLALSKIKEAPIYPVDAAEIKTKFNTWLAITQTRQLERYLGPHVLRLTENLEKIERSANRRKAFAIDYSAVLSALKAIKSTSRKVASHNEITQSLLQILAKTIAQKANQPDSDQYLNAAEEILDSLDTLTPDELKAKVESR